MVSAEFGLMSNDKDPKERESKVKYQKSSLKLYLVFLEVIGISYQ